MKKYIIVFLLVGILLGASYFYKYNNRMFMYFPNSDLKVIAGIDNPLYLFLFFSSTNCSPCLEFIEVLNNLPMNYQVIGVVPEEELKNEELLREITGAQFVIKSINGYKKYAPKYWPSLMGVSRGGEILFILPGVPKENEYLENFLSSFSRRAYPILAEQMP